MNYAELDDHVRHIAARLTETGFGERDVIALRLPDGRRAVAAELAVAAIGAVALPYPPGHGSSGSVSLLARSRARAAIVDDPDDAAAHAQLPDLTALFGPGRTRSAPPPSARSSRRRATPSPRRRPYAF